MSKKFLDSTGVSTLWSRIKTELEAKQDAINALNTTVGEYTTTIGEHTAAIETLNGDAETTGSVAHTATAIAAAKVAEIVAGANASYDTLKEIADWILNDTTGAADMANDIAALQGLVGDKAVAEVLKEAKEYADSELATIVPLTTEEIEAAIAAAEA